jgi:HD-GYP domain-containing protein (c-di-GMP phosphodiesterase class II)
MYRDKLKHGRSMRNRTIELLLRNINNKYSREQIHTERVSEYCEAIAKALNLSDKDIGDIKVAGSLHDVGKVLIPPEILNKEEPLTEAEWQIIKKHPETSFQILKGVSEYAALADSVLYHHERWDGTGYPHGLRGEKIPLFARIIGIADAYEAMTAQRIFQRAKSKEEAIAELIYCSGTQFDPDLVDVFVNKVIYQLD